MKQDFTSPALFSRLTKTKFEGCWGIFSRFFVKKKKEIASYLSNSFLPFFLMSSIQFNFAWTCFLAFTGKFVHRKKQKHQKTRLCRFPWKFKLLSCDYIIKINCRAPVKCGNTVDKAKRWNIFVQLPTTFNLKLLISFCANDFNLCNGSGLWQQ